MLEKDLIVFFYKDQDVGVFVDPQKLPFAPGKFEYEPFRGPGHYDLGVALDEEGSQECTFVFEDKVIRFLVVGMNSGVIDVGRIESISP